jgi:hypothetical protein
VALRIQTGKIKLYNRVLSTLRRRALANIKTAEKRGENVKEIKKRIIAYGFSVVGNEGRT